VNKQDGSFQSFHFYTLRQITSVGSLERLDMDEEAIASLVMSLSDANLNAERMLPPGIDKLRCGNMIEGTQICNNPSQMYRCAPKEGTTCANAKFRAPPQCKRNKWYGKTWNDGWKMYRLKGRMIGLHLIDMLRLAALELDVLERQDPLQLPSSMHILQMLESEEEIKEFLFLKTQPSRIEGTGDSHVESWNTLNLKSVVCANAMSTATDNPQLKLDFDPPTESLCEEFLPFQYSYFSVSPGDGFTDLFNAELGVATKIGEVYLGICLKKCYTDQCRKDDPQVDWEMIEIRVNNQLVSGLESIGGCYFLSSEEGLGWKEASASAQIQIRVHEGGTPLLVSSAFMLH
jgi:hypothetical protein